MKVYSNEIVFRGHPDKVCDQISDAILDQCLRQDKNSRCGIEVVGGKGIIFITGEVTTKAVIDVISITKRVLNDVGYREDYKIIDNIGKQSPDIARGTNDIVGGAGDNGMMFGYACRDTINYLSVAMVILQRISREYDNLRKNDQRFLPDGKAQITGIYDNNKLIKIKTLTICYQNTEQEREVTDQIIMNMCNKICLEYNIEVEKYLINPTGKFAIGGFEGDAGLTGRKIVVDSYQSFANVGGGAFSGKDPTKVDRSGAYKAREIAKQMFKNNSQYTWCEVQLSYAIGEVRPLAIYIKTNLGDVDIDNILYEECTPQNIIKDLDLLNECYEKRQGLGKANLIFVGKIDYNFTESENVRRSNTNISNTKNNNIESQSVSSELEEIKNKCELELFEETDNQGMTNFGIRNMIENAIEIIFIQKT